MLGLLPYFGLGSFIGILLVLAPGWPWKKSVLRGSLLWGTYLVLATEVLSLAHLLEKTALILMWLIPVAAFVTMYLRSKAAQPHQRLLLRLPGSAFVTAVLVFIFVVLSVTATIAWIAPPNTYDSLTYHMSRVAHWAQDKSLAPFATGILRQAYMAPGAEILVTHSYILGANDRLANFVEWFAMVFCLIGAAKVAADLGATERGQWIAAAFVASLPMGIAQASSTMTDYVVAWWVICATSEVTEMLGSMAKVDNVLFVASAAGLALLTKPTGAIFLAPLAPAVLWKTATSFRPRVAILTGALGLTLIAVLNAGYVARNMQAFGGPLGPAHQASAFTNEIFSWRVLVSNVLRNASLHAGTSSDWLNNQLYTALAKLHVKLGLGLAEPRTSWHHFFAIRDGIPSEIMVGNPWQAVLGLAAAALGLAARGPGRNGLRLYLGLVTLSFLLFSAVFKFDMLGSRYHLPFFVLLGPVAGVAFGALRGRVHWIVVGLLVASSIRPLLFLKEMPLLPQDTRPSILGKTREQLLLDPSGLGDVYPTIVAMIGEGRCSQIGLVLKGDTPEYPIWALLGSPRKDLAVDWIIARGDPTGKFRRQDFHPCAVICQDCPPAPTPFNDLPWVFESRGFQLYLREEAAP